MQEIYERFLEGIRDVLAHAKSEPVRGTAHAFEARLAHLERWMQQECDEIEYNVDRLKVDPRQYFETDYAYGCWLANPLDIPIDASET